MVLNDRYHAGGNEKIKQSIPGIKVYGGSVDNVKGCTDTVENGDRIAPGKDISILALHNPGIGYDALGYLILWNLKVTSIEFFHSTIGSS